MSARRCENHPNHCDEPGIRCDGSAASQACLHQESFVDWWVPTSTSVSTAGRFLNNECNPSCGCAHQVLQELQADRQAGRPTGMQFAVRREVILALG